MLNFRTISINDQEEYNKFITLYDFKTCDYSFSALFAWQEYYEVQICFYHDALYIKVINTKDFSPLFYLPITKGNLSNCLENLEYYCKKNNYQLIFTCLEPFQKEILNLERPNEFIFENMIDNADYLYLKDNLKSLSGKKLKNKRNFVNQFKNEYLSNYTYEHLTLENTKEIIDFIDTWTNQEDILDKNSFSHEKKAIYNLLNYQKELNTLGGLIKINEKVVAFSLGTKNKDTMIIHFEKARYDVVGSYQMINYLFINNACQDVTYVNREEDLGIPGLRKAKESYDPIELAFNYNAYSKNNALITTATSNDLNDIKRLWSQSFGNDKFATWFFDIIYQTNNTLLYKLDSKLIAMAQIMNFTLTNGEKITYLYALATDEAFRRQGLMTEILSSIKTNETIILIPENDKLLGFYENLGFNKAIIGYKHNYTRIDSITTNFKHLNHNDISDIDSLYRKVYSNSILRTTSFYHTLIDEFTFNDGLVVGLYKNNALVSYAFVFLKQKYISELVSINKENDLLLIQSILKECNLEEITCVNKYEGTPVYYCYKGDIPDNLYINLLYN